MPEKRNESCREYATLWNSSSDTNRVGTVRRRKDDCTGTIVERSTLFSGIPPNGYTKISGSAHVKEFIRGEMLYLEGDSVRRIVMLTSGIVKINKIKQSGTEVILKLGVPGDVIGAVDLFSTGKHCATAQAFRSCRALVWDVFVFKGLVQRFPILHQNMVRILGEYLLELEERFSEIATEKVSQRVAGQLVRLLEQIGRQVNGAVEIGLSREELAQMTGTTLFTVSRLLCAWEAQGIVQPRREAVMICNVRSLRAIAEDHLPCPLAPSTLCLNQQACGRIQHTREVGHPRLVHPSCDLCSRTPSAAWASASR
jgi:CRP/FNR family transcriptional regulator, nitrogen oxide reductase regulator